MAASRLNTNFFRRYRFASICGGFAVLVLMVYGYRFGALDEQRQFLAQKQSEADSIHSSLRNSIELADHLAQLQKGAVRLEGKLMRSGDVAAYQQFFFKLETDSGVKIVRLQPVSGTRTGQAKPAGAYRPMAFEASVEGTFANVSRFLHSLETGPLHYRMVSFSVRRGGSSSAAPANLVNLAIGLELLGSQ